MWTEVRSPRCIICTWRAVIAALAAFFVLPHASALAESPAPALLRLDAKIPLGVVRGRIDHLAIDAARQRLFVAELGNDSVGVVDIAARKEIRTIGGLAEPQGVGYVASKDTIYVANGRDGSVRVFKNSDYSVAGRIDLGTDADNVRVDADGNRVLVGYGNGAIAAIDIEQQRKIGEIALSAHPESFQIGGTPKQVFVNIPGAHAIAVLDSLTGSQKAKWTLHAGGNFPMAVDSANDRVLIVSRNPPPQLIVFAEDGSTFTQVDTCGDADDLFVDPKRSRVYVSCGDGFVDVFEAQISTYRRLGRISTVLGARTSLFVPSLDALLLAVRATMTQAAAIWVFKPMP